MSQKQYIAIEDAPELWAGLEDLIIGYVPVEQFDQMVDVGYIDLDGLVIADIGECFEVE